MANRPQWDPWHEVRRLQHDLEQLFTRGTFTQSASDYPPINITHTTDGLTFIEALCPGADAEAFDVSVIGDTLTIKGERKPDLPTAEARYHRRQRVSGPFTRAIRLADRIDPDSVQATYAHGILIVQVARAPEVTPRRITVRT